MPGWRFSENIALPAAGRMIVHEPFKLLPPMRFFRADPLMLFASSMQFFKKFPNKTRASAMQYRYNENKLKVAF